MSTASTLNWLGLLLHNSPLDFKKHGLTLDTLQAILEKFEFFPIKCRVQRALELFKETCKRKENIVDKNPMKQKVVPQSTKLLLLSIVHTMQEENSGHN